MPEGNDGFRIVGGLDNDFTIAAGMPGAAGGRRTPRSPGHVGRLLVDGLDVIIEADLLYGGRTCTSRSRARPSWPRNWAYR